MSQRLVGKSALITAAGAGIGRATARAFAREGCRVYATDIDRGLLESLRHECGCEVRLLDVTDPSAIRQAAVQVGTVDILVNAAGHEHIGTVLEASEDEWAYAMDLNVRSMFRTIKAFVPGMLEQGRGSIVNIASTAGPAQGIPGRFVYGTSKAAVIGLTKSVAVDFAAYGVRCNVICPGSIDTPSLRAQILDRARASHRSAEDAEASLIARVPLGRLGRADEIAALVLHLASDESGFTTGAVYMADGGRSA